jgi:hypothetical protein
MRTITIEIHDRGYTVREGDRYHDELCWDEMLGQVTELTHPRLGDGRYAMKTEAEWTAYRKRFEPHRDRAPDEAPVLQLQYQQHPQNQQSQDQEK